jgi:glycosyltransferase involved in cell wall biosynthesis
VSERGAAVPALSIVAPVYNEVDNLVPLVEEIEAALAQSGLGLEYEILLVDDASVDGSAALIERLARANPRVRGLHFRANRGQTAAFDAGFKAARGRIVATIDADLQNDPRDLPGLVRGLEGYDAVVGYRTRRADTVVRRISSRIANGVRNWLSGDDIIDTGCSLKVFRREALAPITLYRGLHRFLPTLVRMEGFRVAQVPVGHRPRTRGVSKYGVLNRVFTAFADLLAVRWMKNRRLDYEVIRHEP